MRRSSGTPRSATAPRPLVSAARAATLAAMLLAAAAGCARRVLYVEAAGSADRRSFRALLERPLPTRLLVHRGDQPAGWPTLVLRNVGEAPLRRLTVRDPEGYPFFEPLPAASGDRRDASGFTLLPGESLAVSIEPMAGGGAVLQATLRWSLDAGASLQGARAAVAALRRARWDDQTGLILEPTAGSEAHADVAFETPLPITRAWAEWVCDPPDAPLEVWVAVERGAWGRLALSNGPGGAAARVDGTSSLAGWRAFDLRLAAGRGATSALRVTRWTVEIEMTAAGEWRPWRPGLNEIEIRFDPPPRAQPRLWVELAE